MFNEHKIEGMKSLGFKYFCEAAEFINKKVYLTLGGIK
jgi:hypothetical protein